MSLRLGLSKMLDAAQKRREIEPAAEAALVSELSKLKKVSCCAPPSCLAVRCNSLSNLCKYQADRQSRQSGSLLGRMHGRCASSSNFKFG